MKLVLDIKDSKAATFVNFIKSLDFIHIQSKDELEEPTKDEILAGIKQGLKEVQLHKDGKIKLQSAKDFLHEL